MRNRLDGNAAFYYIEHAEKLLIPSAPVPRNRPDYKAPVPLKGWEVVSLFTNDFWWSGLRIVADFTTLTKATWHAYLNALSDAMFGCSSMPISATRQSEAIPTWRALPESPEQKLAALAQSGQVAELAWENTHPLDLSAPVPFSFLPSASAEHLS